MKTLTALLIFVLFSCGQEVSTVDNATIDDSTGNAKKPSVSNKSDSVYRDKYRSSIYDQYIDPQLKAYLDKRFKDWTLPAPNRWDTVWLKQYKSDSTLVNYVSGDFDCNGTKDYALLFKKANGVLGAYAFLTTRSSFKSFELMDMGNDAGEQIEIGLELLPPGDYNYIDPDSDEDPPPVKIKCYSVQLLNFERAAKTFYWKKDKLKSITTGD